MISFLEFLKNIHGYYVSTIDGVLIDTHTEQDRSYFANIENCKLDTQPECNSVQQFYSELIDYYFEFNPHVTICFSEQSGDILVTDIYGIERKIKFVTQLQLSNQVYEKICNLK